MPRLDPRSRSDEDSPVIRSRLDTDFYKLLMGQSVIHHRPDVEVTFSIVNRTTSVRLAKDYQPRAGQLPGALRLIKFLRHRCVLLLI